MLQTARELMANRITVASIAQYSHRNFKVLVGLNGLKAVGNTRQALA